jgi:hypothetical protein
VFRVSRKLRSGKQLSSGRAVAVDETGECSRVSIPNDEDSPQRDFLPATSYDDEQRAQVIPFDSRQKRKPSGAASKVVLRHAHEIVAEKRETTWLIHKVIEAGVLAVVAGARGTFKSFIALDWAMRAALEGRTVVILSGEGAGLDRRIDAWMRTHAPDVDLETLSILALERPLNLSLAADMQGLAQALEILPEAPAMVVVDTFSKFSAGIDENDNSEVAQYLSLLSQNIRDAFHATVVLVVHSGHGDTARPRGASSLMSNPDAEYIVQRNPSEMIVTVTRERFKDGSALPPLAYDAKVVNLGRCDQYGEPVTSLALHSTDAPPAPTKAAGKNQQKAMFALKEWTRANADKANISSIDIKAILKTQGLDRFRQREAQTYLVNIRVLTPSIGGYTIDKAML